MYIIHLKSRQPGSSSVVYSNYDALFFDVGHIVLPSGRGPLNITILDTYRKGMIYFGPICTASRAQVASWRQVYVSGSGSHEYYAY